MSPEPRTRPNGSEQLSTMPLHTMPKREQVVWTRPSTGSLHDPKTPEKPSTIPSGSSAASTTPALLLPISQPWELFSPLELVMAPGFPSELAVSMHTRLAQLVFPSLRQT